jgi:hypothetical protein
MSLCDRKTVDICNELGGIASQGADFDAIPHIYGSLEVYHNTFCLSTKFLAYPSVSEYVIMHNSHLWMKYRQKATSAPEAEGMPRERIPFPFAA